MLMLCTPSYFAEYVVAESLRAVSNPLEMLIQFQLSTMVDNNLRVDICGELGSVKLCFVEYDLGGAGYGQQRFLPQHPH